MALTLELERRIALRWPVDRWADVPCLVASSGGADSTALLCALTRLRPTQAAGELIVVHLNHKLRDSESDADARFVESLAAKLGLRCSVEAVAVAEAAALRGDGVEEAARRARYDFFIEQARRFGARFVAVGHTLDDQAETVLHRILRGTGLSGLAGMPFSRPLADGNVGLVRPLLTVRRREVLEYLSSLGQAFRTDSSNADRRYTRNRLRTELLPRLAADFNPRIIESLVRLATQASDYRELMRLQLEPLVRSATRNRPGEFEIDCEAVARLPRLLLRELLVQMWKNAELPLQQMGFDEWEAAADVLVGNTTTSVVLPGNIVAKRSKSAFTATRTNLSPRTE